MHNIQTSTVKLKMTGWEVLAIPLKWSLYPECHKPEPGSGLQQWACMSKRAWPSSTVLWQGGIAHSSDIFCPFRKNNVSKNGITSSVLVSRSLKLCWKNGDTQERAKAVFKKLEERVQILAAQSGPSALKSIWGVVCLHNTQTLTGKWQWGLRQQRQVFGELT